jgi:hypothetical protein
MGIIERAHIYSGNVTGVSVYWRNIYNNFIGRMEQRQMEYLPIYKPIYSRGSCMEIINMLIFIQVIYQVSQLIGGVFTMNSWGMHWHQLNNSRWSIQSKITSLATLSNYLLSGRIRLFTEPTIPGTKC